MCVFFITQGMNKAIDSELLEYSVHAGVQTTLQVLTHLKYLSVYFIHTHKSLFVALSCYCSYLPSRIVLKK